MTKEKKKDLNYGAFAFAVLMIVGFLYNNSDDSQQNSIQINNLMNKESAEAKAKKPKKYSSGELYKIHRKNYDENLIRGIYIYNGRGFILHKSPSSIKDCAWADDMFKTWHVEKRQPLDKTSIVCGCAGYKKYSRIDAPCTWNKNADLVAWAEKGYPYK